MEELQSLHRADIASHLKLVDQSRRQLTEAEALVSALQTSKAQAEEQERKRKAEVEQLVAEAAKAKETAKEEEEKRVKAITLLKNVRQKLGKAEMERNDALKELDETQKRERQERERDKAEKARLQYDIEAITFEREKAIAGLKAQHEKEFLVVKDRADKEISSVRIHLSARIDELKVMH